LADASPNEVLKSLKETLGEEFGSDLFYLRNKYLNTRIEWRFYRSFYGTNPERVQLLNESSGIFFRTIETTLFEAVILGLCRLLDPIETGRGRGARANMTFRRLEKFIVPVERKDRWNELVESAENATEFARDWRNRKIAHSDYLVSSQLELLTEASRERVQISLEEIGEILSWIYREFLDSDLVLDVLLPLEDEKRVLEMLFDGIELEKEKEELTKQALNTRDYNSIPALPDRPNWVRGEE